MYSYQPSPAQLITTDKQAILDKAVRPNHPFRRLNGLINFDKIARGYRHLYSDLGTKGISLEKAFRSLIIQFLEDYSDRQLERALEENMAVKWFGGWELDERTPDHSFFGKFRKRLGAENLEIIFNKINGILKEKGLVGNLFHFIDASGIVTKNALWKERDKAIQRGEEKLNNQNVQNYAADKEARYGCKGKDKFWYGYKRHLRVDMRQRIITKVIATPANVSDHQVFDELCPKEGMVIQDKGYDTNSVHQEIKERGCHNGTILKNNRKDKNQDKDRFLSKLRMPFECVFSKMNKRARYRGLIKVRFQVLAESLAHNLKRLIVISSTLTSAPAFSTG